MCRGLFRCSEGKRDCPLSDHLEKLIITRSVSEGGTSLQLLPSLTLFEVSRFDRPEGTTASSQGRKPLENEANPAKSPVGVTANSAFIILSPLRGLGSVSCSDTPEGLRPGLRPAAATRLKSEISKSAS